MTNLSILETFRTKEELLNYFDEIGQNITEEEIENLKKSYNQTKEINSTLTMQQLDDVAGGCGTYQHVKSYVFGHKNAQGLILTRGLFERNFHVETKGRGSYVGEAVVYDGILGALGIGRVIKMDEQNPELQQDFVSHITFIDPMSRTSDPIICGIELLTKMVFLKNLIGDKTYINQQIIDIITDTTGNQIRQANQNDPQIQRIAQCMTKENDQSTPIYSLVEKLTEEIFINNATCTAHQIHCANRLTS